MIQTVDDMIDLLGVLSWGGLLRLKNRRRPPSWERPLVISMAGIGDLLLATPMIRKISEVWGKPIDVLTTPEAAAVLEGNSHVKNTFFMKGKSISSLSSEARPVSEFFRENIFSVIVSIRSRSGLLRELALSERPVYWYGHPWYEHLRLKTRLMGCFSEGYRRRFYGTQHMARLLWGMVPPLSPGNGPVAPFMFPPVTLSGILSDLLDKRREYVVVHAGGRDPMRKMTAGVVSGIISDLGDDRVVLVGGAEDAGLAAGLKSRHPRLQDMTGRLNLNEVFLLLKNASACIAPDSVVMHMAAAAGTPLVALMGNALPETYGPLSDSETVVLSRRPPCSPCNRRVCRKYGGVSCVQDISAGEILQAVDRLRKRDTTSVIQ